MGIVNFCHKKPIPDQFCGRAADLYSTQNGALCRRSFSDRERHFASAFLLRRSIQETRRFSRSGPQSSTTRRPSTSPLRCWFTVRYSSTTSRAEVDSTRILPFFSTSSSVMSKNGLRLL